MGLLQSALAMPAAQFGGNYLHEDLFHMAAAYLFHISQNHPFIDGNKRTGTAAAVIFLDLNGVELDASPEAIESIARSIAEGKAGKAAAAEFFRRHAV